MRDIFAILSCNTNQIPCNYEIKTYSFVYIKGKGCFKCRKTEKFLYQTTLNQKHPYVKSNCINKQCHIIEILHCSRYLSNDAIL